MTMTTTTMESTNTAVTTTTTSRGISPPSPSTPPQRRRCYALRHLVLVQLSLSSWWLCNVRTNAQTADVGATIGCFPTAMNGASVSDEDFDWCHRNIDESYYVDATELFDAEVQPDGTYDYFWSMEHSESEDRRRRRRMTMSTTTTSPGVRGGQWQPTSAVEDYDQMNRRLQGSPTPAPQVANGNCASWCATYGQEICVDIYGCPVQSGRRRLHQRGANNSTTASSRSRTLNTAEDIEQNLAAHAKTTMDYAVSQVDAVRCGHIEYNCVATLCYSLPTVVGFSLMDATTNQFIRTLVDGDTVDVSGGLQLSIRAEVGGHPGDVGSVLFGLDQTSNYNIENGEPYALLGDDGGSPPQYNAVEDLRTLGPHTVSARGYRDPYAMGDQGTRTRASFTVTETLYTDPTIVCFTLVDAATDEDLRYVNDGNTISLASLGVGASPMLNIRADVGGPTRSVYFDFDLYSAPFRKESSAPFTLGGDTMGDYYALDDLAQLGTHTVTATPYKKKKGEGTQGTPVTISFTITA